MLPLLVLVLPAQPTQSSQPPPSGGSQVAQSPSATPSTPVAGPSVSVEPVVGQLQAALNRVGASMAALQPDAWRVPKTGQQALLDSQASVANNLQSAMPELLERFKASPGNTGAAFRLYRDAAAVLGVAQHSADVAPERAGAERSNLVAGNLALSAALDRLGDWIEAEGSANFASLTELEAQRRAQAQAAKAAPPTPQTLIINDANTTAAGKAKKKSAAPKIPHR
ncbi:MAG: hypothetical protein ACRD01_09195 [Terriglobales bacterium]